MNKYTICDASMIGDYIRVNRETLDLTAKQLALHLNVSAAAVSGWETGIKTPDIFKCCVLAQMFGVTIDEFYSCTFNESIKFKGNRLYDYINEKNKDNITLTNLSKKTKHKIVSNLINCVKNFSSLFENLLNDVQVERKEFEYLSNLLQFYIEYNKGPFIVSVVEKVDQNFDFSDLTDSWDFLAAEPKDNTKVSIKYEYLVDSFPVNFKLNYDPAQEITRLIEDGAVICLDNKLYIDEKEILFNQRIQGEIYDTAYIKDKCGRVAQIKIFEFEYVESYNDLLKVLNKYRSLKKIRSEAFDISDFICFGVIKEFLDLLFEEEFISYFNELMKFLGIEMKKNIYYEYLTRCKEGNCKPKTEILYIFLINEAVIDKTLTIKICKAIYEKKEIIILNDKEDELCLNINKEVHV